MGQKRQTVFQANLEQAIERWKMRPQNGGKKLPAFVEECFPGKGQRRYDWLRKILYEASPDQKRGDLQALNRLHQFLGLEPGALWVEGVIAKADLPKRFADLLTAIDGTSMANELRQMVSDQLGVWETVVRMAPAKTAADRIDWSSVRVKLAGRQGSQ